MFEAVKEKLGFDDDTDKCRAIVDEEPMELCGEDAWGWTLDGNIQYCEKHMPSEAHHQYIRGEPVTFFIPETGERVTKK